MSLKKGADTSSKTLTEADLSAHIPSIRHYLAKIVRPDELEDGVQTVLQRALENIQRFRGDSSPRVWLLGIARNVGFEIARARQRAPRLVDESDELSTGDLFKMDEPNQEERLGRKEQQALALSALDELTLDEKLALLVTYVDGLPGPEAAELLGVSFSAFRQRLSRARQAMAKRLKVLMDRGEAGNAAILERWKVVLEPESSTQDLPKVELPEDSENPG